MQKVQKGLFGDFMFHFSLSKKVYPLYQESQWPYPFWISCTFHLINFTLLTTGTAEKKCLKQNRKKAKNATLSEKKFFEMAIHYIFEGWESRDIVWEKLEYCFL